MRIYEHNLFTSYTIYSKPTIVQPEFKKNHRISSRNLSIIALVDSVGQKAERFCELHALVEDKYEFTELEKGRIALFNELLGNSDLLATLEACTPDVVEEAREVGHRVIRYGIGEFVSKPGHDPFRPYGFFELIGSI